MTVPDQSERIKVDLVWQRLISILEDQARTLIRTAFSTTTRESEDLSAGLFDARGRMMAQAVTGTPGHVNSMAIAVGHFLRRFPLAALTPGDVLVSNDPWQCSGHLHDFTVVTPVFHRGRAVGAVANTVHVVDVGGIGLGPDGREIFEEGLCVPICKLVQGGVANRTLFDLVRANVREPDQVVGDLNSSIIGNAAAATQVAALLDEFRYEDLERLSDQIIDRTRDSVESRIRALPQGIYDNEIELDGYDAPVRLALKLTIEKARMTLDFSNSSRASPLGINVVKNYTTAYAVFGVNCAISPDIPCNHGSLEPVEVVAPEGSILNAVRPAPVSARHMVGHILPDLVLGALAKVIPVPAEGAGLIWNPSIRGQTDAGRPYATVMFNAGGAGAQFDRDGWNATAFPSGVKSMPVEAVEALIPILVRRKALRVDSGGAGQFRGGLGQVIEIESHSDRPMLVNAMFDRLIHPARGRAGGGCGARGSVGLASGKPFRSKGLQELHKGDVLVLELPGGGGFGEACKRSRQAIVADIHEGYVSPAAAQRLYGFGSLV